MDKNAIVYQGFLKRNVITNHFWYLRGLVNVSNKFRWFPKIIFHDFWYILVRINDICMITRYHSQSTSLLNPPFYFRIFEKLNQMSSTYESKTLKILETGRFSLQIIHNGIFKVHLFHIHSSICWFADIQKSFENIKYVTMKPAAGAEIFRCIYKRK